MLQRLLKRYVNYILPNIALPDITRCSVLYLKLAFLSKIIPHQVTYERQQIALIVQLPTLLLAPIQIQPPHLSIDTKCSSNAGRSREAAAAKDTSFPNVSTNHNTLIKGSEDHIDLLTS